MGVWIVHALAAVPHRAARSRLFLGGCTAPVVILPGLFNADVDYKTPLKQPEAVGLVSILQRRGFEDVSVVNLPRWEWLRVAGGLADPAFYAGRQRPDGLAYGWYIHRARAAIKAAAARAGQPVLVCAHSAGGWLARAALADGEWEDESGGVTRAGSVVSGLFTLGAPQRPPPDHSPPCASRGALAWCHGLHPGAHLQAR